MQVLPEQEEGEGRKKGGVERKKGRKTKQHNWRH